MTTAKEMLMANEKQIVEIGNRGNGAEGLTMDQGEQNIIYNTADGKASVSLFARDGMVFYALDMIQAVGFRVRGKRGTQFRIRDISAHYRLAHPWYW